MELLMRNSYEKKGIKYDVFISLKLLKPMFGSKIWIFRNTGIWTGQLVELRNTEVWRVELLKLRSTGVCLGQLLELPNTGVCLGQLLELWNTGTSKAPKHWN